MSGAKTRSIGENATKLSFHTGELRDVRDDRNVAVVRVVHRVVSEKTGVGFHARIRSRTSSSTGSKVFTSPYSSGTASSACVVSARCGYVSAFA